MAIYYIVVCQLAPLFEVLRRELGEANKETINLKKKLDKEVADFVTKTRLPKYLPPSPKLSDTEFFVFEFKTEKIIILLNRKVNLLIRVNYTVKFGKPNKFNRETKPN